MRQYAVKTQYLESPITGDGKWHTHTTKWHANSDDAWQEKEKYEAYFGHNWYESSSSLIHKEN